MVKDVSRRVTQIFLENAILGNDLLIDGDGEDSLDFTYIDDLLQGVEKIINSKIQLIKLLMYLWLSSNFERYYLEKYPKINLIIKIEINLFLKGNPRYIKSKEINRFFSKL